MATVKTMLPMVVMLSTLLTAEAAQPDYCKQPKVVGPCRAAFRRYYFDTGSKQCRPFIYGGCQGNGNNFRSESQCKSACVCTQNVDSGRIGPGCRRKLQRFYYDIKDATCKGFRYSGCRGNSNRFPSTQLCLDSCATSPCFLPPVTGPCRAAFHKYYYNPESQSCETFVYGGCQGNANRFDTEAECNRKCNSPISGEVTISYSRNPRDASNAPTNTNALLLGLGLRPSGPPVSICQLPQVIGPCRSAVQRFFYNSTSSRCEQFVYGGCQANENNFATLVACQRRCMSSSEGQQHTQAGDMAPQQHGKQRQNLETAQICQLAPDRGPCRKYEQNFYYNGASGKCEELIYGGCQGNENRFPSMEACMRTCGNPESAVIAPQSSIPGGGLGLHSTGTTYDSSIPGGGLGFLHQAPSAFGAAGVRSSRPGAGLKMSGVKPRLCTVNIFSMMADQIRAMFGMSPQTPSSGCESYDPFPSKKICSLPSDPGMCYGYFPKYYFNTITSKCQQFIYGGCGGNGNRFDKISECETKCEANKPSKDRCFLPAETGLCKAYFPKFHYNATAGLCEEFIYGGCGGNDNQFDTIADCERHCGASGPPKSKPKNTCLLPPESGNCFGYFPRYHFNVTAGVCEEFVYGGCGGNDNRFDTAEECEMKCGSIRPPPTNEDCLLPPETGRCRAYFPKYFFNSTSGACEDFIYGGCQGNKNRFDTVEECEKKCGSFGPPPPLHELCLLPPKTGRCRAHIQMYHYNSTSGACEQFVYGGCDGNENRFDTVAECEMKCKGN